MAMPPFPSGFALGAISGPVSFKKEISLSSFGRRKAIVLVPLWRYENASRTQDKITVTFPGQTFKRNARTLFDKKIPKESRVLRLEIRTIQDLSVLRPFTVYTLSTALELRADATIPYRVSVGIIPTPPFFIISDSFFIPLETITKI